MRRYLLAGLICCLPALAPAQDDLPVVFAGDVRFRWVLPGDGQQAARYMDVTQNIVVGDGQDNDSQDDNQSHHP